MDTWMKLYRPSKTWPKNVIFQFHHYCNIANPFPGPDINLFNGFGVEPERDRLSFRLKDMVQFIRQNIGNNEIWFGEFGYDTTPCSTALCQFPDPSVPYSPTTLQSEWNIRTHLLSIEAGIDKTFVYNLSDEPSANMGYVFGSSGQLESEQNEFRKKEAWKGLNWLVNQLDGCTFVQRHDVRAGYTLLEFRSGFLKSRFFYWKNTHDLPSTTFKLDKKVYTFDYKVQSITTTRRLIPDKHKKPILIK
jgi:hypothetical protein